MNFIQTIIRYQDDYITLKDLEKLRKIVSQELPENKENLTLSFNSFPKTSAFLSFFDPSRYIAYDGESMPAFEYLSNGANQTTAPKAGFKAFKFYQMFYQNIKKHLKESHLDISIFKTLLGLESLSELHWNFVAQDFLLFISREVMDKDKMIIDISGHELFKLSMGKFWKDPNYKRIDPTKNFEENNLVVIHAESPDSQGDNFANLAKKGDFIYLTYGQQRLSFIARLIGDARPVNEVISVDLEEEWICREVEIIKRPVIDNTYDLKDKLNWLPSGYSTFKKIKNIDVANQVLFNKYYGVEIVDNGIVKSNKSFIDSTTKQPLNQILYGPPGTGKTYKTKALAVEIIDGTIPESREDLTKRYCELKEAGQIHFTTFHQSISYEDFVEGIKPKLNKDNNGDLEYEIKSGLFKQICDLADLQEISNFNEAFESLIQDLIESNNEYLILKTPRGKEFRVKVNGNDNLNLYTSSDIKKQGVLSRQKLEAEYHGEKVYKGWEGYSKSILDYLENHYSLSKEAKEADQKYVLIIDEINRGNVSAIFGELITLLEKDKRAGKREAIEVVLPYSKEKFSVSKNIHIIGTMNTADRSVEALDTALRRRFSFIEMQSDINALEQFHKSQGIISENEDEISLVELLKTINERIELLIDKDHQIGHSYFFQVKSFKDLKTTFRDKIIPLLEEYFYGDFGKIGLILGESFIKPKETQNRKILAQNFKYDVDFIEEKQLYEFVAIENWSVETFQSIYQTSDSHNG